MAAKTHETPPLEQAFHLQLAASVTGALSCIHREADAHQSSLRYTTSCSDLVDGAGTSDGPPRQSRRSHGHRPRRPSWRPRRSEGAHGPLPRGRRRPSWWHRHGKIEMAGVPGVRQPRPAGKPGRRVHWCHPQGRVEPGAAAVDAHLRVQQVLRPCSFDLISTTYQLWYSFFFSQSMSEHYFSVWLFRVCFETDAVKLYNRGSRTTPYYKLCRAPVSDHKFVLWSRVKRLVLAICIWHSDFTAKFLLIQLLRLGCSCYEMTPDF